MRTTSGRARASGHWLGLREPADAAARSRLLAETIRSYPPADGDAVMHDLGSGTGSMCRWLAPLVEGRQHWVLHDRDPELLALAATNPPSSAADGAPVTVETRRGDVTRLHPAEIQDATLITASALLDVMTAQELARLVAVCAGAACPVLITLTVTGHVELTPADPLDRHVAEAFNAHQRRRIAAGRLLGPSAVQAAVDEFSERGYDIRVDPSPWRLGARDRALIEAWLTGWLTAANEQQPESADRLRAYTGRRLADAATGRLGVTVHHQDLLVWPS